MVKKKITEGMQSPLPKNAENVAGNTEDVVKDPKDEKKYYSSFAFMQFQEDTEQFDNLKKEGKYDEMLNLASEYDQEQEINLEYVNKSASPHLGDDLLTENEYYAVVYNSPVGGTYDLLKKYSENELREEIERLGDIGDNPSDAIKEIARNMTADEFAAIQKEPAFEMPNGEILYFQYNKETDKIEVGSVTNAGPAVTETFMFERDRSVEANLESVYDEMSQREEYREQDSESDDSQEDDEEEESEVKMKNFTVCKSDELDRHFFHIEAEGEKPFDIVPDKKYVNSYKHAQKLGPEEEEKMRGVLFSQFYKLGKAHPELTQDLVSPRRVDVDMSRIGQVSMYRTEDFGTPMISAQIDGKEQRTAISKAQYDNLSVAEDKTAYKAALAAVSFESILKPQENKVPHGGQKAEEDHSQRTGGGMKR